MVDKPSDETPYWSVAPARASPADEPSQIGPYKILQVLGTGGMGVVYLAEQSAPVERRVALKVVKLGMDTKEVVARFEAERQALALMDHPGIARVFDAGATESGRPYFAMELVRGVPFTEYCDTQKLRVPQRIELFIEVCRAVQHAHQKGIIHRDLKPSNVLVALQDGRPAPKIIDFGIAKAVDRRLTDLTLVTSVGAIVGTPAYMSPEQLETTGLDVDTRADIFSLGVMLYETLTGTLPRLAEGRGVDAVLSLRRLDDDPPFPSARISALDLDQAAVVLARRQSVAAGSLAREVRGDLDWITLKALARDRTRRYEAASALAADLQRYLRNETVTARPPSARYRVGKFVRRHRAAVAMATMGLALVVGFATAMAIQAARVARERDRAEREAARVTALNRFMTDMLGSANPWGEGGRRDVTVVEALQRSAHQVDESFAGEPLLAATARHAIGATFAGLGRLDDAEPLLTQALEARRAGLGATSPQVADTLQELAALDRARGRYEDAVAKHEESLGIRERNDPEGDAVAEALTELTQTLFLQGRYDEAEQLGLRAVEIRRRLHGRRSPRTANSLIVLAKAVSSKGDYARAEDMVRECLAIQREAGRGERIEAAQALNDLAVLRLLRNDLVEAEALYREALALDRRILGDLHPEVASALENLGGVLFRTGRPRETLAILDEVLAIRRKGLGEDSLAAARTLHNRAVVQTGVGELAAAEAGFRESTPRLSQALGADHPEMARIHANYARLLRERKDYPAAEQELRQSLAIAVKTLGPEHEATAGYELDLGQVLVLEGRHAEAAPLLERGFRAAERGGDAASARRAAEQLVVVYARTGRRADAQAYERKLATLKAKAP